MKHLPCVVVAFHAYWLKIVVLGAPTIIFFPELRVCHLAMVLITLLSWIIWGTCPLTMLEKNLRTKYCSGKGLYTGSFTSHYSRKYLRFTISDSVVQITMTVVLFVSVAVSILEL